MVQMYQRVFPYIAPKITLSALVLLGMVVIRQATLLRRLSVWPTVHRLGACRDPLFSRYQVTACRRLSALSFLNSVLSWLRMVNSLLPRCRAMFLLLTPLLRVCNSICSMGVSWVAKGLSESGAISPLPQAFTARPLHRGEQILDHPALPGLDLGGDGHAGGELDALAIDQHVFLAEGQGGGIDGAAGDWPGGSARC